MTKYHHHPIPLLSDATVNDLRSRLLPEIACEHNVKLLKKLSLREREYFSFKSKTVTLYLGDEVRQLVEAEEASVLRATPSGYPLIELIGLNVGCGGRFISPFLLPVDIMRKNMLGVASGEHAQLHKEAFLALPDDLPFKKDSVDLIVSLHMLEHVENPIETVNHWLDIVKPGGGIGIVVPDWRYTWDSRNDHAPYSHKWNPTPTLIERIYKAHWKQKAELEQLCSYDFTMSFDFVLRKHGNFEPFAPPAVGTIKSGAELEKLGMFLSEETFKDTE